MPKIRNILIFSSLAVVFILIYFFFFRPSPEEPALVSSASNLEVTETPGSDVESSVAQDFLTLLLSVKNIKLDDSIFTNPAFNSLHDSSITLTPDGNEGRANPFAQFGVDVVEPVGDAQNANPQIQTSSPAESQAQTPLTP